MAILTLTTADAGTTVPLGGTVSWEVVGTDGVDNIQVAAGTAATVKGGAGVDVINLTGGSADYTVVLSGTSAVFTHTATGKTVSVPVTGGSGDSVSFGTGTAVTLKSTGSVVTLGTQTITTTSAPITGASGGAGGGGGGTSPGQAFTLTNSPTPDSLILTSGNDTVTGAAGTLAAGDNVADAFTTDADIANLTVNTYAAGALLTMNNVETVNVAGAFTQTGLDFTNINGTKQLNLTSAIAGSTGTATGVALVKVAAITAGSNIGALVVTPAATGTGGAVAVNTGSALTTTVGNAGAGADNFNVTVAGALQNITATPGAGVDTLTLNLSGGATTLTTSTAGLLEYLNVVSGGTTANTLTAAPAATLITGPAASAYGTTVSGSQNLTIVADPLSVTGLSIVKATDYTGTLTLRSNVGVGAATDYSKITANTVQVNNAGITAASTTTLNNNSALNLTVDDTAAWAQTFDMNNAAGTLAAGAGTLVATLGANQTVNALGTGANVGVLSLSSSVATTGSTVAVLAPHANTTTVALTGANPLTFTSITLAANETIASSGLTGTLTVTGQTGAFNATIVGGTGNDSLTISGTTLGGAVRGGDGNDTIAHTAGATTQNFSLIGDAGNDTITGGNASDTISGGTGVDNITSGTLTTIADTVNGGDGADVITLNATAGVGATTVQMGGSSTWGDTIAGFSQGAGNDVLAFSVSNGYAALSHGTTSGVTAGGFNATAFGAAVTTIAANTTVQVNTTNQAGLTTAVALQAAGALITNEVVGNHVVLVQYNTATTATVFDIVSANTDGAITAADTVTIVGTLTGLGGTLAVGNFSAV